MEVIGIKEDVREYLSDSDAGINSTSAQEEYKAERKYSYAKSEASDDFAKQVEATPIRAASSLFGAS